MGTARQQVLCLSPRLKPGPLLETLWVTLLALGPHMPSLAAPPRAPRGSPSPDLALRDLSLRGGGASARRALAIRLGCLCELAHSPALVTSAEFLLPCKVTHGILVLGCGCLWAGILPITVGSGTLFFKKFSLVIYLFLAVLGLCFCARAFSSCGERGPLFIAVRGPLTVAASLVAEHKLQTRSLSSCGTWA